jgi:hypothetical protein
MDTTLGRNELVPVSCHPALDQAGGEDEPVKLQPRTRIIVAWSLWLASFGCCAVGLVVALAVTRPLTLAALAEGAAFAVSFPLGYATIGLVLSLRRPANPIGWLYAVSGLAWSLMVPLDPWVDQLVREGRPLPLAAQLAAVAGEFLWAPGVAFGLTCRSCCYRAGGCARGAGGWWWSPP